MAFRTMNRGPCSVTHSFAKEHDVRFDKSIAVITQWYFGASHSFSHSFVVIRSPTIYTALGSKAAVRFHDFFYWNSCFSFERVDVLREASMETGVVIQHFDKRMCRCRLEVPWI